MPKNVNFNNNLSMLKFIIKFKLFVFNFYNLASGEVNFYSFIEIYDFIRDFGITYLFI
jgi:hypothetical protein